jgi:site-specific recombinase XerD
VRCLARTAGIGAWEQLSPRCLRHLAITFALDAGAFLRDVQDYASRKIPHHPPV